MCKQSIERKHNGTHHNSPQLMSSKRQQNGCEFIITELQNVFYSNFTQILGGEETII